MTKEDLLIDYLLSIEDKRGKNKDKAKTEKLIRKEIESGVYNDTLNLMQSWADESAKESSAIIFPTMAEMRKYSETNPDFKKPLNSSEQIVWRLGAIWMRYEITKRNKSRK